MNHLQKLAIVSGLFAASDCLATDYYFEPRFSTSQRYDTNLRMQPKPPQDNWITKFSPGANFGFRKENSELKTNFTWSELVYDNQSELNIAEQLVDANYKLGTERFTWGLATSYSNQSNLTTNYVDSGAAFQAIQLMRHNLTISPSVSYAIDKKTNLSLTYNYTDLSYDKNPKVRNLYDYTYNQGSINLSHSYTEKDKLGLTLSTSLLDMPAIKPTFPFSSQSQTSLTETAQISWEHSFNEQLLASIAFGINHSHTDSTILGYKALYHCYPSPTQCFILVDSKGNFHGRQAFTSFESESPSTSKFGQIFNASLQKAFERGSVSLSASQQLSPTTQGNMQQTVFDVGGKYKLSERWSSDIDGLYQISTFPVKQQINNTLFGGDRTYYAITPRISWEWTPEITLQLSYTYRQQTLDGSNQPDRISNSAMFQFNYQPQINRQVK
jgi:hypothetical protein